MRNYEKVQLVAYGTVTSAPVRVLPDREPTKTDYQDDLMMRAATLCNVANLILTDRQPYVSDPTVLKVLVVPEFYFRYGGPVQPGEGTLNDSYPNAGGKITNMIEEVLVPQFSTTDWNDWLIVAGSVFWHVPAKDNTAGEPLFLNTSIVINGGELPVGEADTNSDPATVPTMGRVTTNQKRLMSRLDWSLDQGEDKMRWDAALNPMFKPILGDAEYLRWHRFKARGKGNAGGQSIVFGVEVCLEHVQAGANMRPCLGVLRLLEEVQPLLPAPDVHVVTSCGMDLDPAFGVATEPGGIAMLCDGMEPDTNYAYPWPTADVRRTVSVSRNGVRQLAGGQVVDGLTIPDQLQVGFPYSSRTPADRVSIWEPVDLP
ncbi:hypothetical protein [Actinophytocola sp.]|uniref:hypothetical protein n=1 Tax=Actinophytocola sp. TaxID=1872138 RepID=UPI003899C040